MKKITLLFLSVLLLSCLSTYSQTIAWSSDSEDLTGWSIQDLDGDGNNWAVFIEAESLGFATGNVFGSNSWDPNPSPNGTPLTPDNILFTPTISLPSDAININFKMKIAAANSTFFAENFAVYVYDDALGASFDNLIYEERLTEGGDGTAKDINAAIPNSFANKTIGLIIRHYDCTDQLILFIDDFEVSHDSSLSINNVLASRVKILSSNKTVNLYNLPQETNYTLFNINGQKVLNDSVSNSFHTIEAPSLSSGVYIIEIEDTITKALMRKKIVL